MTQLKFEIEWEPADGVSHPALAKTWSRLEIVIGDEPVTKLLDKRTGTTRSGVYGPSFVLAEWMVRNFWFALNECQPSETPSRAWLQRHSLAACREGTALPDLRWFRDEDKCVAEWRASATSFSPVEFVSTGSHELEPAQVRSAFCDVVDSIIEQLRGCEHPDVVALRADWDALASVRGGDATLCQQAARLGLDAFDDEQVTEDIERILTGAASRLPLMTRGDFFDSGVSVARLSPTLGAVAQTVAPTDEPIAEVVAGQPRKTLAAVQTVHTAYARGYCVARELRAELGQKVNGRVDLDGVLSKLGWPAFHREDERWKDTDRHVKAAVGISSKGAPVLVAGPRRSPHARFLVARGMYALLSGATGSAPRLLTSAGTSLQASSRAFAAELLAPAEAIRVRIGDSPDDEAIDDVAQELDVSTNVICHQIENHLQRPRDQ